MEEKRQQYVLVSHKLPVTFETAINNRHKEGYEILGAPYSHGDRMHVLMKYVDPTAMADMMSKMMKNMQGQAR